MESTEFKLPAGNNCAFGRLFLFLWTKDVLGGRLFPLEPFLPSSFVRKVFPANRTNDWPDSEVHALYVYLTTQQHQQQQHQPQDLLYLSEMS